ncbi:MAG: DUF4384 domain-containing protein [Gemmatimonadetes bacterium]|nr:DUF4384 domain-containing protein [Gemmatimonadota bacterium]
MLAPLLLALVLHVPAPDNPPVRVSLKGGDAFLRGDRARVQVRVQEDGYVVVLRADADGRVRVLFPLDPGDDAFVRGGKTFEIRGRGGREAFFVDEREGTGLVLAGRSTDPFRFDEFVRGDHWDYRVLGAARVRDDPEAGLLDIVRRMAGGNRFDYDMAPYTVESPGAYRSHVAFYPFSYHRYYDPFWGACFGCYGWYRPRSYFSIGFVFGSPYRYRYRFGYFSDPFFYDPFYYGPYYDPFCWNDPFCMSGGFAFTYPRVVYRGGFFNRPPFVLRNDRSSVSGVGPRQRWPAAEGRARPVPPRSRVTPPRDREPTRVSPSRDRGRGATAPPARVSPPRGRERGAAPAAPRSRPDSRPAPSRGGTRRRP